MAGGVRMTKEQFVEYCRKHPQKGKLARSPTKESAEVNPKPNKYHSERVWMDGFCFDSMAEANFYCRLKMLLRAGAITGFCRQPRFIVTESPVNGKRGSEYRPDLLVFYPDGHSRIVDVKGVLTPVFKLKLKMMREKYPKIKIELED